MPIGSPSRAGLALALALAAALPACRGCSASTIDPSPRAAPTAEESVRPAVTAAVPAARITPSATILQNGPPTERGEVLRPPEGQNSYQWFADQIVNGTAPLTRLLDQYPATMRQAAERFLHCAGATNPEQCQRLWGPGEATGCRILSAQLRMRARGATGWGMPDEALPFCRALRFDDAGCRAIGQAAETGTIASCNNAALGGFPRTLCVAAANGAVNNVCGELAPNERRTCERLGRDWALLREGLEALRDRGRPPNSVAARGMLEPASCERVFRDEMRDVEQLGDALLQIEAGAPAPAATAAPAH